ncbi:MAG: flagellar assembly protein FliW [Nocardioides sp.]
MTDLPVIEMVRPMPGFPEQRRFTLVQLDDDGVLCSMTSIDEPNLRFLVAPPGRFFPDYAPEVEEDVMTDLAIESSDDVLLLVVLNTAGGSLATTTANLAAPVLVNPSTRRGGQIVLDAPGLPVAAPLIA